MRLIYAFVLTVLVAVPARAEVNIQEVTSPGGLKAWLVEEPSIPFVALDMSFRGGASLEAAGKRGAINLMTALLEEGAGSMDAREFARASEGLASSFRFNVDDDELNVSARFLTENQDASVALLKEALQNPSFDTDAIERVRDQVLLSIRSSAKDPGDIARKTMDGLLYGDHPYGSSLSGSVNTVSALTRDDLVAAHRDVLTRDRIFIGVAGDITPQELGLLLDDLLGGLPETGAPLPAPADVNIPSGVTVVDFPTPQSVALFAQKGIPHKDEDWFAATVMNHILGGGSFESRLMAEVREKRGLTYGVYSYLAPMDLAATYQGSVSSANDRIAEAISVIRDEWKAMAENGATAQELDDAKTYITGSYPLRFDGNQQIAGILVGMQLLGLPIDYIATRNDKVDAVTLEDVRRVSAELLDPEGLAFVVVGQPEGLEATAGN
ncbi:MAG: insulinase family protein [Sulfitobacter sp.]|nr:insulinase family protein [Sulfitobacter sp.]